MTSQTETDLFHAAHELHAQGALCEAVPYYNQVLRLNPMNLQAAFNLGQCQYDLRRFKDAECAFEQLSQYPHNQHIVLKNLSYACLAQGNIEKGALALLRSLALDPTVDKEQTLQVASREILDFVRQAYAVSDWDYDLDQARKAIDLALAWDRRGARATISAMLEAGERLGLQAGARGSMVPLEVLAGFYLSPRRYGLDIGSGCNLRCVYCCDVDSDATKGVRHRTVTPKPIAELDREIEVLERLGVTRVDIGGHGEPTVQAHWVYLVNRLADRGYDLTMISNFAKRFSDTEIRALARLHSIVVSCDTVDKPLAAAIRPPLDVEVMFDNLRRVREVPGSRTQFLWNTVLSDLTVPHLVALVEKGIELGISQFNLNAVIMHPYARTHGTGIGMRHLSELTEPERVAALAGIQSARALAVRHGKQFWTDQAVVAALKEGFSGESADGCGTGSYERLTPGSTRNCLFPWIKLIASRDHIHVCCHIKYQIDCFDSSSYQLDGEPLTSIRRGLLEGCPAKECVTCRLAPAIPVPEFRNVIANLYNLIGTE